MPQPVMIQTEPMAAPVNAKKAVATVGQGDQEAFSAQFNKHIQQGQAGNKAGSKQAANTAESDNDIAADGNNLPSEADASSQAEASTGQDPQTAKDVETSASNQQDDTAGIEENADAAVDPERTATVNAATEEITQAAAADSTDKPVRAQVSVSQQAVDHAKAAPVEMTAKPLPRQIAAGGETVNASAERAKSAAQTTANTTTETLSTTATDNKQTAKNATPNLAATLKQLAQEKSDGPKIRADILDALQRHQGKQEISINLRNLIAVQVQQAEGKAATNVPQLPAVNALTEASAQPLGSATTLSGLVSSGQTAGQTTVLTPSTVSLPVQPNMQNPSWGQVMSSRVVWMAKEGVHQAELRMNPANLGPVEVKLHIQNDQASVTFLAQQSATREALEQALPRLRESFAESGMELADAQVGEQEQQQQDEPEQAGDSQIFSQASRQDDDIDNEAVEMVSSEEATVGLSIYA